MPLARMVTWSIGGVAPNRMGIGPVPAIEAILKRQGLRLADVPVIEVNEAFATQTVAALTQAMGKDAAENFMRVNVNTFFGLGGVLDVASELNIDRHREDFGQTLGRWGVPAGPYVVLPFLGPSTVRDTLALPVDRRGDPVQDITPQASRNATYVLRAVDIRANLLRAGAVLDEAALDKYSFQRDAYLQRRRAEIFDGNVPDPAEKPEKLDKK